MNLINRLHRPKMIHSRVDSDLVEDDDARVLRLLVEVLHGLSDVGGSDDVDLGSDG